MKITPIKTHKVIVGKESISAILDKYLPELKENSILAVTSKIVSICEGNVIRTDISDRTELIKKEADFYIPPEKSKFNFTITIKNSNLNTSAGIDRSNSNGFYVFWPENPQKSVNNIRDYLITRFNLKHIGVLITDSKKIPLRKATVGFAISHSGFKAINNYIGKPDIFGQPLKVTKANISDSLASAAVAVIGEGNEQTPLCIIEDIPFVQFQSRNPSDNELAELNISLEDDLYAPVLKKVEWIKGNKS